MMRFYSWLIYLLPPSFRKTHGSELLQVARTAHGRGDLNAASLTRDLCASIVREWIRASNATSPRPTGSLMQDFMRDVRYAVRLLLKNPGFALAAVATLALGIGANTAMFTLADATILRPVKVVEPERLASWTWTSAYPDYLEYTKLTDTFEGVLGWAGGGRVNIVVDGPGELAPAMFLSGNAFNVLGIDAAAGRVLLPSDDVRNAAIVGVLSYDYWQSRFGGDPHVIGRLLRVNDQAVTIIGVSQHGFRGLTLSGTPSIYLPISATGRIRGGFFNQLAVFDTRNFVWVNVVGRLQPGVSLPQASAVVETRYRQIQPGEPGDDPERLQLSTLKTRALGGDGAASLQRFVLLLMGVVVLTLLIGCANLANLLLAKSAARRQEMAIRLSVGANRGHVVRQMLVESVMLSLLGGVAGLVIADATLRLLTVYQLPGGVNIRTLDLSINLTTLTVTAALALLTGILFGAAPAWQAARTDAMVTLRESSRSASASGRLRGALVGAQVAISLVLLVGSGLFLRSLVHALAIPTGFVADGVATASVNPSLVRYDAARARAYTTAAIERVRQLPGVTAVAWTNIIPINGLMMNQLEVQGYESRDNAPTFYVSHVTADYFAAAGTRLLRGRAFSETDREGAPPVAIISRTAAERFWRGRDPIGTGVKAGNEWRTIVGVVEDVTVQQLDEARVPYVFFPFDQSMAGPRGATEPAHILVRTSGNPRELLAPLAAQLRSIDPQLPVYDVMLFTEHVRELVMPQQMGATLMGVFSVLALSLAAIGIYGVSSYVAQLRTRELGIRMALGADAAAVRTLILQHGVLPAIGGVVAGLALALWAARFARTFLYDVSASDPLTFIGVALGLVLVALAATWIPARRAARLDPVAALRES